MRPLLNPFLCEPDRPVRGAPALILALATALVPLRADAESRLPARVEIVSHGEYRTVPNVGTESAPDTSAGVIGHSGEGSHGRLIARTADIVANEGVTFGMLVAAPGFTDEHPLSVTVQLDHPPLTTPDGRVWRTETFETSLQAEPNLITFCFEHGWELASGEWTYTILHDGRPLAGQRFNVVVDPARRATARCTAESGVS